jgi:uncharacterized Zn finger protein (UPF0148 family)
MQTCPCGSTKIENKDSGLCASCNRQARKAESKPKAQQPLKRTQLRQVSTKKKEALNEKHKTYDQLSTRGIRWCETCGLSMVPLSHSHTLPVGAFPRYEAVASNIIMECYGGSDRCHDLWEHNKARYMVLYPAMFNKRLAYILEHEPGYHRLLSGKLGL